MECSRIDVVELVDEGDSVRRAALDVGETWPSESFTELWVAAPTTGQAISSTRSKTRMMRAGEGPRGSKTKARTHLDWRWR